MYSSSYLYNPRNEITQAHPTIKFTTEWSRDSVSFLDTTVKIVDGRIVTDLYVKPTDTHQYLAANSCHPRHCKEAIPYSQALRMRRICCSLDEAFNKRITELKEHLTRRGMTKPPYSIKSNGLNTSAKKMPSDHQQREQQTKEPHWWYHTTPTSHT